MSTQEPEREPQSNVTRRRVLQIGTATVLAPAGIDVVSGATASGEIELTTTSTQPANTDIAVRINEDTNGDGTPDFTQKETIPAGTDVTTTYAALTGGEGSGNTYWLELTLSTTDDTSTPELSKAVITLPETETTGGTETPSGGSVEEPDNPQSLTELFQNYSVFVTLITLAFGVIGMWGKSLSVGAFLAYLAFAYIALSTQTALFVQILYVTLVLIFIGFAFKLFRLEFSEGE